MIEDSDSDVELQDHYSSDVTDNIMHELDESGFDELSPAGFAAEMCANVEAGITSDGCNEHKQGAINVICPVVEGHHVPQTKVCEGSNRSSKRK